MGVFVSLPVDGIWNSGSNLQAGLEIYHWGYLRFWLILSSRNDPVWDPYFTPPCSQLAVPYLYAFGKPRPNFKSCTWAEVLGPASYPVCHWPCPGRASRPWR